MSGTLAVLHYHRRHTDRQAQHDAANVFGKIARDLSPYGFNGWQGRRLLDLGCGQRMPVSLLAAASGAAVTALDINYVHPHHPLRAFPCAAICNGVKRATWSLARQVLFDRRYYGRLFAESGADWRALDGVHFVWGDPFRSEYPLPSSFFDAIVSNAVLEHVTDVHAFARELGRLLKPSGLFYGMIHNFYSLSGGHNMSWAYPDADPPRDVDPWDHLRRERHPAHVYLNRLGPEEYRAALEEHLDIITFEPRDASHDPGGEEGRGFLTAEVREELREYSEELLLTRAWCVIARRRTCGSRGSV